MGTNYAKVIHSESDANGYVISFTTKRDTGPNEDRHFLFAKYGIKVPNSRNTVIVHRPTDAHGTTLPNRSPEDEDTKEARQGEDWVQQNGISMVIQQGLPSAWSHTNGESSKGYEAKKRELERRRKARLGDRQEAALKGSKEASESHSHSDNDSDGEDGDDEGEE